MLVNSHNRAARSVGPKSFGFTLIELMVVVSILAVLAGIAAPSFRSFIGTMNSKSAAFDLIGDWSLARSEAVKQNQSATVIPLSGSWSNGWQIVAADGATLRTRSALVSSLSISCSPVGSCNPVAGVTFRPNGRLSDDTAAGTLSGPLVRRLVASRRAVS